jgi:hypothetical protein
VTELIVCGECGELIECTVYSARSAARRRRRFLVVCCASAGSAIAFCCYAGLYFSLSDPPEGWKTLVIPLLGILLLPALGIMAWGLLTLYREEDGVRIKPTNGHVLREPGAVADED